MSGNRARMGADYYYLTGKSTMKIIDVAIVGGFKFAECFRGSNYYSYVFIPYKFSIRKNSRQWLEEQADEKQERR